MSIITPSSLRIARFSGRPLILPSSLQTLCCSPHNICGEEAKLEGKPLNRALRDGDGDIYDIVAGKFFICGLGDENFASLPKELQQKYEEKFRQPEAFLKMGSKIMAIPTEPQKTAPKGKAAPATER